MCKLIVFSFLVIATFGFGQKINGVNFVSAQSEGVTNYIAPLDRINANYLALTPFMIMHEGNTEIDYEIKDNYYGDFKVNMIAVINQAHFSKKKIMLKPHIWIRNVGWAGNLNFSNSNWKIWQNNYEKRILDFAHFAEEQQIEAFCIGVELKNAVNHDPDFFVLLIKKVRAIYSGKITYAANWDNYFNVPFWEELDYIGIDCYFPISNENNPSKHELKKSWQKRIKRMKESSLKHNRKIVFTEFGYRSTNKALGKQWEIEYQKELEVNLALQELGYEVFFEEVYSQPFVAGGFLWKWYAKDNLYLNFKNNDYTPQHKPVERVIKRWYSKK